jgi:carbon storage regulator CsrA
MLVLSRKVGERIHIGENIFVEVRRIAGNRVTISVCAPNSLRILRGELIQLGESHSVLEEVEQSQAAIDTVIMSHAEEQNAPAPAVVPLATTLGEFMHSHSLSSK